MATILSHVCSRLERVGLLWMVVCVAGCAHYGFANRPIESSPSEGNERPVAVTTVATPAHWGVDGASLTRSLVRHLHDEGLSNVRWRRPGADTLAVRCSASGPEVSTYRRQFVADVRVICRLEWPDGTTDDLFARSSRFAGVPLERSSFEMQTPTWTAEMAVLEALRKIAPDISQTMRRAERGKEPNRE